jgi:hypothetical protein
MQWLEESVAKSGRLTPIERWALVDGTQEALHGVGAGPQNLSCIRGKKKGRKTGGNKM